MDQLYPFAAALLVMLVSLSGVIFSANILRAWMRRNLPYLATFSAGVFLIVIYHLLSETLHESASFALAGGSVLAGALLIALLHHLLPAHHHHETDHDHSHTRLDGRRVLLSDGFHNVGDGVLLVATFAVSASVGFVATIGIVLHEFAQEISEYFVLRGSGYSLREALMYNFLSSSSILFGVVLTLFLSSVEFISILFAGIAAGGFLTVLVQDLVPNAVESVTKKGAFGKHVLAAFLGVALMLGIQLLFPHEEKHQQTPEEPVTSLQILSTLS